MTAPTATDPAPQPTVVPPVIPPAPPPAPAPVPAPLPNHVPPAPTPPTVPPVPQVAGQNGPDGYPVNTPLVEMSMEQQTAYWRHHARRHEQRVKDMADYDQLKADKAKYDELISASQTEHEKAIEEARRQGASEAAAKAGDRLVEAYFHAAAVGRLDEDRVNALLDGIDRKRFLAQNGEVDTARVYAYVGNFAPATAPAQPAAAGTPGAQPTTPATPNPAEQVAIPPRVTDFGQGQPASAKPSGLAAGAEIARKRFGTATAGGQAAR